MTTLSTVTADTFNFTTFSDEYVRDALRLANEAELTGNAELDRVNAAYLLALLREANRRSFFDA